MSRIRFHVFGALCALAMTTSVNAAALDDIKSSTAEGKAVFVIVTDAASRDLDKARAVAKEAHKRAPNSAVVELNRSDPAQKEAVAKYRVATAPVPFVMVVAANGSPVGAIRPTTTFAVDRLVALVPTAAKAKYMKILGERRVAAVVFTRASMRERSPLFEEMSKLARMEDLKLGTVLVDLDDPAEQRFIAEWKLDPKEVKRPLMIFVNPKGQVLGRLEGKPTVEQMVTLSKKRLRGCQDPNCTDPNCKHGK